MDIISFQFKVFKNNKFFFNNVLAVELFLCFENQFVWSKYFYQFSNSIVNPAEFTKIKSTVQTLWMDSFYFNNTGLSNIQKVVFSWIKIILEILKSDSSTQFIGLNIVMENNFLSY